VKVLFDHNVPHKLVKLLPGHRILVADEMGWSELENGELLRVAEESLFEVFVTADRNLPFQQHLSRRKLAFVVLSTNNWNIIKQDAGAIEGAIQRAKPGEVQVVSFDHIRRPGRRT
jgi:hypothetical protein